MSMSYVALSSQVGDELLEVNGYFTDGMFHMDAITIIKHGGDIVKLIVRRVGDSRTTNSAGIYTGFSLLENVA